VASTVGSAAITAFLAGIPTERLGRKITILSASLVFVVGSVIMGLANTKELLLVGRIVVGVGIGLASMSVPVYISEAAPPHLRGPLTVSYNTLVVFGQFCATVVCGLFVEVHQGWRYMLGLAAVPAALQFIGFIFMPKSPRWLLSKGKVSEARAVLKTIRLGDIEQEVKEIQDSISENSSTTGIGQIIKRCLSDGPTRRALLIGCSLQVFQQLSGINTLMYYSATIVQMAGIGSASSAIWISAGISFLYFLACFIGVGFVERLGRRKLLLISLGGVVVSLAVIGAGFQLADLHSPPAQTNSDAVCGGYTTCSSCLLEECGFCATGGGSCLSNSTKCEGEEDWFPDYCPSEPAYSWTIIVGLAAYLISFAAGMAPIPWTVNSEIYPLWARSFATSVSTGTNWVFNLIISITFLSLTRLLTRYGAFYLYCGLGTIAWVLFLAVLPETRGLALEDIHNIFAGNIIVLFKK